MLGGDDRDDELMAVVGRAGEGGAAEALTGDCGVRIEGADSPESILR